ncbi:unnamed protein product [Blepharisma stoltei]|uniref:Uncharacterized protein n=1 Tax=Blepharisma stoltei TaxID=1481888 RepID=A0AAU9JIP9_9CILI|nr:unnamed protein product [Blepharisma stoltei]
MIALLMLYAWLLMLSHNLGVQIWRFVAVASSITKFQLDINTLANISNNYALMANTSSPKHKAFFQKSLDDQNSSLPDDGGKTS